MRKLPAPILGMLGLWIWMGAISASEPNHVFSFQPDTIYGYNFGDSGISIQMKSRAKIIDSIRVRVYPWINGNYQTISSDLAGGAGIIIPDAIYLNDFSLTDNIRLKKMGQAIRIRGVNPSLACYVQNSKYDVRLRFFAKKDSGEIKVIQEK